MLKEEYEEFKREHPKARQEEMGLFFYEQKKKGVNNKEIYALLELEGSSPGSAKARLSKYRKAAKDAGFIEGDDNVSEEKMIDQNTDENANDFADGQGYEGQTGVSSEKTGNDIDSSTPKEVGGDESSRVSKDESADSWEQEFPKPQVMMISIDKLEDAPEEWNFFKDLSKEKFVELMLSIKRYGIQHNLVVQEMEGGKFRILSGHQRVKACKELFETTGDKKYEIVPCKVYKQKELVDEDARRIVIFTNTAQRGDLSLEDRVRSVEELTELEKSKAFYGSGSDVKEKVAKVLGVSRSEVFRLQNLTSLDKKLFAICGNKSEGKVISVREGEVLSKLTPDQQAYLHEKEYYKNLTPSRLSELKNLKATATVDVIDEIFSKAMEYRYSVVTTIERPDKFETIGIHVRPEEKIKLGELLSKAINDDITLSTELKNLLMSVAEELRNSVNKSLVSSAEKKEDATE